MLPVAGIGSCYLPGTSRRDVFFFRVLSVRYRVSPIKRITSHQISSSNLLSTSRSPTVSRNAKEKVTTKKVEYSLFSTVLREKGKSGLHQFVSFGIKAGVFFCPVNEVFLKLMP